MGLLGVEDLEAAVEGKGHERVSKLYQIHTTIMQCLFLHSHVYCTSLQPELFTNDTHEDRYVCTYPLHTDNLPAPTPTPLTQKSLLLCRCHWSAPSPPPSPTSHVVGDQTRQTRGNPRQVALLRLLGPRNARRPDWCCRCCVERGGTCIGG